jgi:hypothetical protein
MKRLISIAAFAAVTSIFLPQSSIAQTPPPSGHPLVGKWQWTRPQNKCTEVYDFRADGTAPVTSGAEKTDNTYSVGVDPDQNGFYRLTMKSTKDYGGKDCGDDESDSTGQESTNYILFDPSKTMHIVCADPKMERCFGPLRRVSE